LPPVQAKAAAAYPDVTFVLAPMGMHLFLWEAIVACQDHPNVFVDTSQAFPFDIQTFVREVGIERVCYGSDVPYQSPVVEQAKLRVIGLDERELRAALRDNAARLWGID